MRFSLFSLVAAGALMMSGCIRNEGAVQVFHQSAPQWRAISLSDSAAVAAEPRRVEWMDELAARASIQASEEIGGDMVAPDEIYTSVIDLRDPSDPRMGSHLGAIPVYPASVVKLCYMVTAMDMAARGDLVIDEELQAELLAMIAVSSNPATNSILDRISNTSYGPDLDARALDSFTHKRGTVARHMEAVGLPGLRAVMKTYGEGTPFYGRDIQFLGPRRGDNYENSNMMTTDDTARLLYLIQRRSLVSPQASDSMLELMRRGEGHPNTFFDRVTPPGATLFSKSGSTGLDRHDAGIFVFPEDGGAIIVVSFSKVRNRQGRPVPRVIERAAEIILEDLMSFPGAMDQATGETAEEGLERLQRARQTE